MSALQLWRRARALVMRETLTTDAATRLVMHSPTASVAMQRVMALLWGGAISKRQAAEIINTDLRAFAEREHAASLRYEERMRSYPIGYEMQDPSHPQRRGYRGGLQ